MTTRSGWGAILGLLMLASQAPAKAAELDGEWRWQGLVGEAAVRVQRPLHYTLEFRGDGSYSVRADCNRGNGTYELDERGLKLGPAAMTMAACPPGSLDQQYLRLLAEPRRALREGDRLLLVDSEGAQMEFELAKPLALPGSRWNVRAVNDGKQAVKSLLPETAIELAFSHDSSIWGSAGCNSFTAGYVNQGEELRFEAPAATRRLCAKPEGLMEQEAAFLAALETVARFRVDGDRLQLRREDGALAVDAFAGVTGSLVYHRREVFPAGSRAEILLEDVSLADAPATPLASQSFEIGDRQPPVRFELRYDPLAIAPRRVYSVRARITDANGKLLFTTTTANPVISDDSPISGIDLLLDEVREP